MKLASATYRSGARSNDPIELDESDSENEDETPLHVRQKMLKAAEARKKKVAVPEVAAPPKRTYDFKKAPVKAMRDMRADQNGRKPPFRISVTYRPIKRGTRDTRGPHNVDVTSFSVGGVIPISITTTLVDMNIDGTSGGSDVNFRFEDVGRELGNNSWTPAYRYVVTFTKRESGKARRYIVDSVKFK